MGSLDRLIRPTLQAALAACFALPAGAIVQDARAEAAAGGLRIIGPEQVLREFCVRDADGILWFRLPGGATFELVTSVSDPAISNRGSGAFHAYDESEVRAAIAQVRFPLEGLRADIFLLPYPRRGALDSGAGPGVILLAPGVAPMPAERQHAEVVHELGHVIQYQWLPDGDGRWAEYRRHRGIEDHSRFAASAMHADRPHEIFAEDFRALFGGAQANYSGSIENPGLPHPAEVPGLEFFMRSLPGGPPSATRLTAGANPARGPVAFALPGATSAPLDLFDVGGRRITALAPVAAGARTLWRWDGRDAEGRRVPRGMVLARVRGSAAPAARLSWLP